MKTTGISESLTTLRDEARVQLHLLSMDARKQWDELEEKLLGFESKLDHGGEKFGDSLAATERELAAKMREFLKKHSTAGKTLV